MSIFDSLKVSNPLRALNPLKAPSDALRALPLYSVLSRVFLLFSLVVLSACEIAASPIEDYKQARQILWESLYPYSGNTLYCGEKFDSDYRKGVNVEHVFPMSWVTSALDCGTRKQCRRGSNTFNRIEADLHNLFPARSDVNADRGAFAFGEINGEARRYGKACDFEVSERQRLAEPAPAVRGDVARAMFYMAHRYKDQGLTIFSRQGRMLQQWHQADPPTKSERDRNGKIESLQGNRNPFIDAPEQLDQLIDQGVFF